MENLTFTWRDLKRVVNKMPESRLDDQVTIWTDEQSLDVQGVMILKEGYCDDGDCGVAPISIMRGVQQDAIKAGDYDKEDWDLTPVYPKGTRIIEA